MMGKSRLLWRAIIDIYSASPFWSGNRRRPLDVAEQNRHSRLELFDLLIRLRACFQKLLSLSLSVLKLVDYKKRKF